MAALEIVSLDTTTPQLRAPSAADTYTAPRAMDISPVALTGVAATSSLSIAQTWNTTGTPTALDVNVTDTASNASSLLMNLRVGGTSRFYFGKDGSLAFGNDADSYFRAAETSGRTVDWVRDGMLVARFGSVCGFATSLSLGTNGAAGDVILARDAANTLAQRNGVNAQAFNIYNTYTDASNYERGFVRWSSNRLQVGAEALGTGTQRDLDIQGTSVTVRIGTTNRWFFYASNHFGPAGDATQDIGTSSLRVRNFFQGGGYHEMAEMTAPAAPATNSVRIYAQDNGAGKTQLMALFATGAAQQIAIEP